MNTETKLPSAKPVVVPLTVTPDLPEIDVREPVMVIERSVLTGISVTDFCPSEKARMGRTLNGRAGGFLFPVNVCTRSNCWPSAKYCDQAVDPL